MQIKNGVIPVKPISKGFELIKPKDTGVEHEVLYNVSKRTFDNNKAAEIDDKRSNTKVAEATDEHVEGAKGCLVSIGFENNNMKVRRGTNYASLIGYNYDIKHGRNENMRPKAHKSFDRKPAVALNLLN
ncbi:6481_t:CDS:2 [Gigaspora margarita]|uniref:6481_t:CDS:1 n=1 Tax=Gigaspora margarita TaxID=4874 RepID=A0ABN7W7J5_GIGMA|nr:6481_t:CDS:2 [Gigaspora margarita]